MAEIDLTPTEEMAANAARGLELRRKHGKGGTEIGVARARDISNRKNLSPETVRRMHAFFSRHEKNKAGGEDDAGYIAWLLWGGDSGQSWAKRKVEQMDKGENQRSDTYKEIAQRLGSAAKHDRPGAKAKMGNAEDVRSLLAQAEQMIWTAKRPEQKREVMELVKDAERMIDASMPSGFRMRLDRLKQRIASEFSRFGVKVKMAMTPIRVTEAEYAALAARDAVSRKILGDSQYQITPSDRAIRAAGDAAYKTALARHNAWDKAWRDAPNDAARAEVEARAKAAEAGMRVYRGSRPGAKAKFAVSITGRRGRQPGIPGGWLTGTWDGGKWAALVFAEGSAEYGLPEFRNISKLWIADKKGKDIVNYDRGWDVKPATPEARQAFMEIGRVASAEASKMPASRPGAKAKMALTEEDARKIIATIAQTKASATTWSPALDAMNNQRTFAQRLILAHQKGDTANIHRYSALLEKAGWSRPGAKAKMGRTSEEYAEDVQNTWAIISRWVDSLRSPLMMENYREARQIVSKLAQVFARFEKELASPVTRLSRPGAKVSNAIREGEKVSASDDAVSRKIRKLMDEGKPQKQAVAIALDLERRGEL